ncbi:MAG: amidohydrolase [Candidatus Zixiibacteriota bacterium]
MKHPNLSQRTFATHLTLTLVAALVCSCSARNEQADLLITGGKIYTMNPSQPEAEALVVRAGRILYVGAEDSALALAGVHAERIDLKGGCAVPGLIDAHAHLIGLGRSLKNLNLVGTTYPAQIRDLVSTGATSGGWVRGRGWDQNDWEVKEYPSWRDLEGATERPVYLRRVDGHACWVNKAALDISGVTRDTPDPEGGRIIRDENGEPTGVFIDNAISLISRHIPEASFNERMEWARVAIAECNRYGLVGVHDAGIDSLDIEVYGALHKTGELTLRVYGMLDGSDGALLERHFAAGPATYADGRLNVRAVKIYADGALGSRGAALLEPYSDEPEQSGLLQVSADSLMTLARGAAKAGFQACTHAIGDAGARHTLDAYESALKEHPNGDRRFRVEHAQIVSPQDIPRFARLGVIASMQPTHATSDMYWAEDRVGDERIKGAYAWKTLLNGGTHLAFGSDFPVEGVNPLWGVYAAVTRRDKKGWPEGGWRPSEALTLNEALGGFTLGACYAEFAEGARGSLEVGKLADVTLFGLDIFTRPPIDLLNTKVTHTIIEGQVVYRKEG